MTIGDTTRFAFEWELDADHCGEWLYGCIYCWLSGSRMGNGDCTCLRAILFELEHMRWPRGDRKNLRLFDMSGKELVKFLHQVLYSVPCEENAALAKLAEEEGWIRHQILPGDPSFCGLMVYCVQNENFERLIWTVPPYDEASEITLPIGEVHSVLEATVSSLQATYERERQFGNPPP